MLKRLIIILAIIHFNLSFAENSNTNTPNAVAVNIIEGTLLSLKTLKELNTDSTDNIENLVLSKLMPNIAVEFATKAILRDRWDGLTYAQQTMFIDYITQAILQDYVQMLSFYENLDTLNIETEPGSTSTDRKASVKLHISTDNSNYQFFITLKMIKLNRWYIYDAIFPGIGILSNYRQEFDSIIKRKGMSGLITLVSNY